MANIDNLFRVDNGISLNDDVGIFQGSLDPTIMGYEAPIGSVYIKNDGQHFSKHNTNNTDWSITGTKITKDFSQTSTLLLRTQTTNNTVTEMFLDEIGGSQRMILPNDTTWTFRILVTARRTDVNNQSAAYQFLGAIDRNASAGTTALVAAASKTVIAENVGGWDCNVNADTTNGALRIQVTGVNGSTINWAARVELVEVTG